MNITRRFLLRVSVALGVLTAVATRAGAQSLGGGSAGAPPFYGDPNAVFTNIDISGNIVLRRKGGQIPAFVHASASGILASGNVLDANGNAIPEAALRPYERLEFSWDFNDPMGSEIFTNPVTGQSVNANNQQIGPEAAYVYRTPGPKTITLHIRGKTTGGGYIVASVSTSFEANAYKAVTGHWYFDSVNGNDSNNGLSPSTPKQSLKAITSKLGNDVAIYLAYGSSWTKDDVLLNLSLIDGPLRVAAYNSPLSPDKRAKPQLICSGGQSGGGTISIGNLKSHRDFVFSDLDVRLAHTATSQIAPIWLVRGVGLTNSDIYFDNCDCNCDIPKAAMGLVGSNPHDSKDMYSGMSVWGGRYTQLEGGSAGIIFGAAKFMSFVGVTMHVKGAGTIYVHQINPEDSCNHLLCRWVHTDGSGCNFCIEPRCQNWNGDYVGGQVCIADNFFSQGTNGINFANPDNTNPGTAKGYYDGVVVERNVFTAISQSIFYLTGVTNITARDNHVWAFGGSFWVPGDSVGGLAHYLSGCVYRNLIYKDDTYGKSSSPMIRLFIAGDRCMKQQEITDNIFCDARASASNVNIFNAIWGDQLSCASVIDRNQYYAPANNAYLQDASTPRTLSDFQSFASSHHFEPHGFYQKPNWSDPSHGKFS